MTVLDHARPIEESMPPSRLLSALKEIKSELGIMDSRIEDSEAEYPDWPQHVKVRLHGKASSFGKEALFSLIEGVRRQQSLPAVPYQAVLSDSPDPHAFEIRFPVPKSRMDAYAGQLEQIARGLKGHAEARRQYERAEELSAQVSDKVPGGFCYMTWEGAGQNAHFDLHVVLPDRVANAVGEILGKDRFALSLYRVPGRENSKIFPFPLNDDDTEINKMLAAIDKYRELTRRTGDRGDRGRSMGV